MGKTVVRNLLRTHRCCARELQPASLCTQRTRHASLCTQRTRHARKERAASAATLTTGRDANRPFTATIFDPFGNILLRVRSAHARRLIVRVAWSVPPGRCAGVTSRRDCVGSRPFYWITSSLFVTSSLHDPIGEVHMSWHLWRRSALPRLRPTPAPNAHAALAAPLHLAVRRARAPRLRAKRAGATHSQPLYLRGRRRYSLYCDRAQFASIDAPLLSWEFTCEDEAGRALAAVDKNFAGAPPARARARARARAALRSAA